MSYLKKYEYAIAVAAHGGISQAAEKLGISQPTFSKYLKKLEGELGVELFDRSTLPIRLTPAGECFVNAGKRFIDLDRQFKKQLEEIKSNQSSIVRVGVSPSRSPYILPDIIELYREKRPNGGVVIEERTTAELNRKLATGELDIVISILDSETESFERIELFDESIMLAVSKKNSQKSDTAMDILATSPLINVGKGQAMWQTLNEILDKMNLSQPNIECQSIESALALVKKGIGAMIVPSYISRAHSESVNFMPLDEIGTSRRVCLFYRKEQFLTQAERDFIDCVIEKEKTLKEV